jgi:hypothetical protein
MRSATSRRRPARVSCLVLLLLANGGLGLAQTVQTTTLPNPQIMFLGQEPYQASGKSFIRYRYLVENFAAYPNELFAAAPKLPPCGLNTRASRTWVDIFDLRGKRLYGFCALGTSADLDKLWFALEQDEIPPSYIYIEMTDRQTGTKYKSQLSETTQ